MGLKPISIDKDMVFDAFLMSRAEAVPIIKIFIFVD